MARPLEAMAIGRSHFVHLAHAAFTALKVTFGIPEMGKRSEESVTRSNGGAVPCDLQQAQQKWLELHGAQKLPTTPRHQNREGVEYVYGLPGGLSQPQDGSPQCQELIRERKACKEMQYQRVVL
ncbi:hypothetical protein EI94DRAFT_1705152 [Lactarius quietus]|nr:hypothetical protein EI94DRAFT_1705152 [Lactarius quietus]